MADTTTKSLVAAKVEGDAEGESLSAESLAGRPIAPTVNTDDLPPTLQVIPTIYPTSDPVEECLCEDPSRFWETGADFDSIETHVLPPETALEVLEQLGPSPFPRGRFPLIGFLATTYDKVSRYALERGGESDESVGG